MKVKCVRSFVDGMHGSKGQGDVFEMPEGVDWLKAGFVVPVEDEDKPPKKITKRKTAAKPRTTRKRATKK